MGANEEVRERAPGLPRTVPTAALRITSEGRPRKQPDLAWHAPLDVNGGALQEVVDLRSAPAWMREELGVDDRRDDQSASLARPPDGPFGDPRIA